MLPLRLFFFGRDDDPQYFDGVLGPSLILLLPWAFKGKWLEEKKLLMSFALLFFLLCLVSRGSSSSLYSAHCTADGDTVYVRRF